MTFRLGSLRQYWFIGLVVLWVAAAVVFLLAAPKPTVEQQAASSEQPGALESAQPVASESGQPTVLDEEEALTARVVEVLEEGIVDLDIAGPHPYQRLLLHIETGSLAGQEVVVEHGTFTTITEERLLHPGDQVYLERVGGPQGDRLYISDYVRTGQLFWIVALFVGLVVLVGRGKGLRSLVGTLFSLLIIFAFVVPQILAGQDPMTVSITDRWPASLIADTVV